MEMRTLGKTGEQTSILGFGAMRLPVLDPQVPSSIDEPHALAMVRTAIDNGVNYVDTAYPYHRTVDFVSPGASEPFIGRALADGYRDKVLLATKLPTWFMESAPQMEQILDSQLQRLNTSHIDMYLAHNLNGNSWPRMRDIGMFDFLEKAKRDGKIRHIGFSFHDTYELFEEIINAYDWSFCQIQFNYLDIDFQAGSKGLALAASRNIGVVVMEPLRGGFLINGMPEPLKAYLRHIRPDWSMADWAFRWVWSQPGVGTVLSGMSALEHVNENVSVAQRAAPLTAEEEAAITHVRTEFAKSVKVNCTGCGYCMPCPQGVNIPKVFGFYNDLHRFTDDNGQFQAKNGYRNQVRESERAANCIACGVCESNCPQSIKISEEMPRAAKAFA